MITTHIALTCATPTQAVRANVPENECLMASEQPGTVLGLKIMDSRGQPKNWIVFHLWDNQNAQLQDPRLEKHLKTFLKILGGAHIWDHQGLDALNTLNTLLIAKNLNTIDRPIKCITELMTDFDCLEKLATHLAVPDCDILTMASSSKTQLRVLETAWRQYLKLRLDDVTIMNGDEENDWRASLSPADKRRTTLLTKKCADLNPVDLALALLEQKGVSDSVLSRLGVSRATDGI